MNDFNLPSAVQEEVVEEAAEEEAAEEEAAVEEVEEVEDNQRRHQHQLHPNNQYLLQQTLKPWEDFPKSLTETVPRPTTSSKK
jgi:hypothetical protein